MALYDVIIIGAGAAGLSCADQLIKNGKNILVLEAQNHIGGRARSRQGADIPIELGAEFIHGAPAVTLDYMRNLGLNFYDVIDERYVFEKGRLRKSEGFWDQMDAYRKKMAKSRSKEKSIAEFIATQKNSVGLEMFAAFVGGFHAADLKLIGEKGFLAAEEVTKEDDLNETELFRPTQGYSNLWKKLVNNSPGLSQRIKLNSVVKEIDYSSSIIQVKTQKAVSKKITTFRCRLLVVTVPVGVLNSIPTVKAHIHWNPETPPQLRKFLSGVEMGHIQKLTLQFKTRFWEELTEKKMSFFHTSAEHYFPTWWNYLPLRSPHLVAWQGGPKAREISHWEKERIISEALTTLGELTQKTKTFLKNELVTWHHHDWSQDPFAQGAYSYIRKGGVPASKVLNRSAQNQIYFGGEATDPGSGRGTVHGAMNSGIRIAEKILKKG